MSTQSVISGGGGGGGTSIHDTDQAAISGGGVGGASVDDPDHAATSDAPQERIIVERRVEAYDRENEDLDNLAMLISAPEEQPSLGRTIEEPIATDNIVPVQQYHLGPSDLQACLRQGEWNDALDILTQMVREGKAGGAAVNSETDLLDIRRTHPELVLLLRGQALVDLKRMGDAIRADAYYRNYILDTYPDGSSTGSVYVDTLRDDIKAMAEGEELISGKDLFKDKKKTRQFVNDYLKIYFPSFQDVEVEEGTIPLGMGLFGEKQGNDVRCLICHVFKKKRYTEKKMYYHQMRDRKGKQKLCPASTEYIRQKILKAQAQETEAAAAAAAQSLPPLPNDAAQPEEDEEATGLPPTESAPEPSVPSIDGQQ